MSTLLTKLGLAPSASLAAAGTVPASAPKTSKASSTGNKKSKDSSAKAGAADKKAPAGSSGGVVIEPEDFDVAAQIAIGQLVWSRRTHKVWGFADRDGRLCKGGSSWQYKDLARMNALAAHAVNLVVEMQELEEKWRLDVFRVREGAKAGAAGLANVEKAMDAIAERSKKDKDFFQDVNAYLRAESSAKAYVPKMNAAHAEVKAATYALEGAVKRIALKDAEREAKMLASDIAKLEAKRKAAQEAYKTVIDIAKKLIAQDWKALAEKAIHWANEKTIDSFFTADIQALQANLSDTKKKIDALEDAVLTAELAEKQQKLEAAINSLEAVKEEFVDALDALGAHQANAQNELKESKSTAPVAEVIAGRTKQLNAITDALASCKAYLAVADKGKTKLEKIAGEFAKVGSWLDLAAKSDPAFDRDTNYAKVIEKSSRLNADVFWTWASTVPSAKRECSEALAWVGDKSDKGPMGDYEKALKATSRGLKIAK